MEDTAYSYKAALNPQLFIIDAVELRPLSLAHLIALETVCSPFLLPVETKTAHDVTAVHYVTALFLCGHSWEDIQVLINNDAEWNKYFGEFSEWHLKEVVRKTPGWNLDSRTRHFQHGYMNHFINSMPVLDPLGTPTENTVSGMDWKQNVKTIFSTKFGYDENKIMNMSLTQLYYEWASFSEINGMVKVRSLGEQRAKEEGAKTAEEFRRKMKELYAKKEAQKPC